MDLDLIKEKIKTEITKTEAAIARYAEMKKPNTDSASVGHVSRMNDLNNQTIAYEKLDNAKTKLLALNKVLSQVGTDAFGKCQKCQKPIALGRILIRPQSLLCVNCAA